MARSRFSRLALSLSFLAVLGAACGRLHQSGPGTSGTPSSPEPSPAPSPSGIPYPTGPGQLVIRVEQVGGFIAPTYLFTRIPMFSLFGDDRVIIEGAQTEIYPQPALPPLLVQQVTPEGVQRLLELARAAGLMDKDAQYMNPRIADATTTVFTVVADGRTVVVRAYALGEGADDPSLPPQDREGRRALLRFIEQVTDLTGTLGADNVGQPETYEPAALRLLVQKGDPTEGGDLHEPEVAWPLDTPLSEFGQPAAGALAGMGRCGVVEGADLAALMPAVRDANQISPWTSDGKTYGITFRPLLPDESGCDQG